VGFPLVVWSDCVSSLGGFTFLGFGSRKVFIHLCVFCGHGRSIAEKGAISIGLVVDFCGSFQSDFLFVLCSFLNIMIHNSPLCLKKNVIII